ncbi:MAG TPA: sensor histidine kinase [Nitrososphaeraceae archaeon]|nr:sensor histidine kinase [Nitrososphaeraceae archaeon]
MTYYRDFFFKKRKEIGIMSVVLIIISSFSLFFYQQNITEQNVKNSIFTQYRDRQIESTQRISEHISSDLKLLRSILQGIADSSLLQQGLLYGDRLDKLMYEKFSEVNNVTKVDTIFIADKDDVITYEIVTEGTRSFMNIDLSFRDYIQETKNTLRSTFSDGFIGIDNIERIALAVPIINRDTGEYMGIIGVKIPTESFFSLYGNVHDIDSQYLVVYDKKGTLLAVGADKSLVSKNFFSEFVQNFTNHNPILINLTTNLLQGIPGYAIYDYGRGELLTTNIPLFIQQGKPLYFIEIVTPTSTIYSAINNVLFGEKLAMLSLIVGIIASITTLIIFLIKWNIALNNEVKKRTKELQESNKEITLANDELKVHDKMQKEFINVAAHELRTPIMPILGLSELLYNKVTATVNKKEKEKEKRGEKEGGKEKEEEINLKQEQLKEYLQIIVRNSYRLQKLVEDILDVTKIESRIFTLNTELVELNEIIANVVSDFENIVKGKNSSKVQILYGPNRNNNIFVNADKTRLTQVISNILDNALKFTQEGFIIITTRITKNKKEKNAFAVDNKENEVLVIIKDSGIGIDHEILPRLFTKFATKSDQGTGLGLYIIKKIIEAHGGRIWAENNSNGRGSTFYFSLSIVKISEIVIDRR